MTPRNKMAQVNRPFVCLVPGCSSSYARSQHLSRHIRRVHDAEGKIEPKEVCPHCLLEFANMDSLKLHEKRFHTINTEGKLYQCPEEGCDRVFHKRQQVVAHREKDHDHHLATAARCHRCPHEGCDKSFLFPGRLKRHMKVHQGYRCDLPGCGELLPTWTMLRKHKVVDHPPSLVCDICDCTFKTRQILVQHVKIHSSKEPIICPREGCERTFLYKKNLTQHIRAYHEGKLVFIRKPKGERKVQQKPKEPIKKSAAAKLCGFDDRKKNFLRGVLRPTTSETSDKDSTTSEEVSLMELDSECSEVTDSVTEKDNLCRDDPCISDQALTG